ncbi:MAG: electron transfer flavoprotein subunit beta/FixA family protein [Planctomycetota bacterium]|jgi:electron transfer flavoprotein beta subunit
MELFVCMKRVPDSAAKIRVADDGLGIDSSGVEYVISPYEEMALERALQLKEEVGGNVTVVCLGPPEATKEIRQALAMGADKAIHIKDAGGSRGPLGIAKVLAETLRGREFDTLLFGRQSIDADNCAVGIMVAQLLGLPAVSLITKIDVADGKATVHREAESGTEVIEVQLPAVFTAQRGLAEPRYPSIKGIMMAKKKPIEEVAAPEPSGNLQVKKLAPPAAREGGRVVGEGPDAVPELVRLLRQEAKVL